jgi:hypothetical protein
VSAVPVDVGRRIVGLLHGVPRKTGSEQGRAVVDREVGVASA